jgi:hypothetical protein
MDNLLDKLLIVVVFAMILERGFAYVFELRLEWPRLRRSPVPPPDGRLLGEVLGSTLKALLVLGTAYLFCRWYRFEIVTALFGVTPSGDLRFNYLVTALVVAGGSAGAIKLFQDVLGWSKTARDAGRKAKEAKALRELAREERENVEEQNELLRAKGRSTRAACEQGGIMKRTHDDNERLASLGSFDDVIERLLRFFRNYGRVPTQLPGTVRPPDAVIYDLKVGGDRIGHVVVMGSTATAEVEAPAGTKIRYRRGRDHWFLRTDGQEAARLQDLLTGSSAVTLTVVKTGAPGSIANDIKTRQQDSRFEFRSISRLSKEDWTKGKPSGAARESVVLSGLEAESQRFMTFRLEIDLANTKITGAVWHSGTDSPDEFFDGDAGVGDSVSLQRLPNDPWASGSDFFYDDYVTRP